MADLMPDQQLPHVDEATRQYIKASLDSMGTYVRRWGRRLAIVVVAAILLGGAAQYAASVRDGDRDEALKYQRCDQTAQTAIAANRAREDALELSRRAAAFYAALGDLASESTTGTDDQRRAVITTAGGLERKARETLGEPKAPVPDCAATYPRGFKVTREIGIVAPVIPPTTQTPAE